MKASEAKLLDFLSKSQRFIIPIYQRSYSWTERECGQIWDDIIRTGDDADIKTHFVGSIVYVEYGLYQVSRQSPLLVIDGQQRLTTISLILEALARKIPEEEEPIDGFSPRKIQEYYLLNYLEAGERRYKLSLNKTDKQTLLAIVDRKALPAEPSIRIKENFAFFEERIEKFGGKLESLCKGLEKLTIVDIALNRDHDNPQLIFESMNSTGRKLTQADLIRNFVLMGLEPDHQTRLYEDHWRPMEKIFGQEAYGQHFDSFMRHYLTMCTGEIPRKDEVYEAFKTFVKNRGSGASEIDSLIEDVHAFAGYYCAMAFGKETDSALEAALGDLRELKVDVAYPLLLELYCDYRKSRLAPEDFVKAIRLIESYVFRRAICAIPTNSLNKIFANFSKNLDKDRYLENFQAHFLRFSSYRCFPTDQEFHQELIERDLYKFTRRSYLLRRLENHDRKEEVQVEEYTIEHIMPQNESLSPEWQTALGEDWERVQETYVHTLGNLTLTGYNSEYSDRSFSEKRDMKGGFRESPLRLNEDLRNLENWNEENIRKRGRHLAMKAIKVWAFPDLAPERLDAYRPQNELEPAAYSIEDHDNLAQGGEVRRLFDSFRKKVLDLDTCITEEFLKLYIAYKAETNVVDVVAQRKNLKLWLNLDFHELHDPRGIARNVTDIGHHGNGNIELRLESEEDIPYVMGLVRQAFEKQMGDSEAEA